MSERETYAEARRRGGEDGARAVVVEAAQRLVAGEHGPDVAASYGTSMDALRRAAKRLGVPWPTLARGWQSAEVQRRAKAARGIGGPLR